jgi:RNA polymerase sigma-70 factor (ECF subfamily)
MRESRGYTHNVSDLPRRGRFATTRWSMVLAAGTDIRSKGAGEALTTLCETYWYPLYAFLRSRGQRAEDAEDLTQAFFARLLDKQTLQSADPARGRFRSFLLTSLVHFVTNEHDKTMALKRGGGMPIMSLARDTAEGRFQLEPSTDETPERSFDRRWAITLLERVTTRLESEMAAGGKQSQFDRLKSSLTGDEARESYAQLGAALGMSEGAVKVAVHRLRKRFRQLVRDEIAQTVSSADQIDDELRHLWNAVRGS